MGRQRISPNLEEMLIFTPGDLKSIPLSELHLVSGPDIQCDILRGLWNALRADHLRSDQSANIRPSSDARPFLDACSMVAGLNGEFAGRSILGARRLALGDDQAPSWGSNKEDEETRRACQSSGRDPRMNRFG